MTLGEDWLFSAVMLITAWNLSMGREVKENSDVVKVGATLACIPIPWSLLSFSPQVTKAIYVATVVSAGLMFVGGVAMAVMTAHLLALSYAAIAFVFAVQYCKRPYELRLGSEGFSWHGKSYGWDEVNASVDRSKKLFHIRVLPNANKRPYGALTYLHLTSVSPHNIEVIDSIIKEHSKH